MSGDDLYLLLECGTVLGQLTGGSRVCDCHVCTMCVEKCVEKCVETCVETCRETTESASKTSQTWRIACFQKLTHQGCFIKRDSILGLLFSFRLWRQTLSYGAMSHVTYTLKATLRLNLIL